uniref:Uncharacterized protein n=1 Tax=Anguilla anguilla TaxID=7936 RepID=A0A0E9QJC2_ANGAN
MVNMMKMAHQAQSVWTQRMIFCRNA